MNKLLPYEEDFAVQLKNIQLPDEDMAWDDMRKRLDDDKDRKPVPVPFRFWPHLSLLLITLITCFVLYNNFSANKKSVEQTKSDSPKKIAETTEAKTPSDKQHAKEINSTTKEADSITTSNELLPTNENDFATNNTSTKDKRNLIPGYQINEPIDEGKENDSNQRVSNININSKKKEIRKKISLIKSEKDEGENTGTQTTMPNRKKENLQVKTNFVTKRKNDSDRITSDADILNPSTPKLKKDGIAADKESSSITLNRPANKQTVSGETNVSVIAPGMDSIANAFSKSTAQNNDQQQIAANTNNTSLKDSNTLKQADTASLAIVNTTDSSAKKKIAKPNKPKSKAISFAAGASISLPLNKIGPQANSLSLYPNANLPIDSSGANAASPGKWQDYIPSIYARIYKGEKWFLQAEFKLRTTIDGYDILFSKVVTPRNALEDLITQKTLTKAYYMQVPVTINYSVSKNWSVGTGVVWNKFTKATGVETQSLYHVLRQRDSVLSSKRINIDKSEKSFLPYFLQWRLETQYRWKRFSLGMNYSVALQPFQKFVTSGGEYKNKSTGSFQLFLRYEIWNSKKGK
jgi:hypothetical protein